MQRKTFSLCCLSSAGVEPQALGELRRSPAVRHLLSILSVLPGIPSRPNILPLSKWIPPRWQRMWCERSDGTPLISQIQPGGSNPASSGSLQTLNVLKELTTEPFHFSSLSICHPSTSLFFFIPSEFGQITAAFITEKLCLHLEYALGRFPSLELLSQLFKNYTEKISSL